MNIKLDHRQTPLLVHDIFIKTEYHCKMALETYNPYWIKRALVKLPYLKWKINNDLISYKKYMYMCTRTNKYR